MVAGMDESSIVCIDFASKATSLLSKAVLELPSRTQSPYTVNLAAVLFKISESLDSPLQGYEGQDQTRLLRLLKDLDRVCEWPRIASARTQAASRTTSFAPANFPQLQKLVQGKLRRDELRSALGSLCRTTAARETLLSKLVKFDLHRQEPTDSVPAPQQPEELPTRIYQGLLEILQKHMICSCASATSTNANRSHECCLSLSTTLSLTDQEALFDTAFQIAASHSSESHGRWKLIRFRVPRALVGAKGVKTSPQDSGGAPDPPVVAEYGTLIPASYFCRLLLRDDGAVQVQLRAAKTSLYDIQRPIIADRKVAAQPSVTLASMLRSSRLSDGGKLILAHTIAKSIWQFYESGVICTRWTIDNVHFLLREDRKCPTPYPDSPTQPFVLLSFTEGQNSADPTEAEFSFGKNLVHWAPRVFALGVILTYIMSDELIPAPEGIDAGNKIAQFNDEACECRQIISDSKWPALRNKGIVSKIVRDAVAACFDLELFNRQDSSIADRKSLLFDRIVWPLEYAVQITGDVAAKESVLWQPRSEGASARLARTLEGRMHTNDIRHLASPVSRHLFSNPANGDSSITTEEMRSAREWMVNFHARVLPAIEALPYTKSIKVAVLDTGINFDRRTFLLLRGKIKGYRSWCSPGTPAEGIQQMADDGIIEGGEDTDGHGTHVVSVLHKVSPMCDIYVAKVFNGHDDLRNGETCHTIGNRVAKAIDYVSQVWDVDMISMSFGFTREIPAVRDAINRATSESRPRILLAAASNGGGNFDIHWPATHDRVICIHATNGDGNKYGKNPTPSNMPYEFATLGCGVEAWVGPGRKASHTGTSVATPIAAGVAALVLQVVQAYRAEYLNFTSIDTRSEGDEAWSHEQVDKYERGRQRLGTAQGMSAVFELMAGRQTRDGYRYIRPWQVLHNRYEHHLFMVQKLLETAQESEIW